MDELLRATLREITDQPARFAAEVVQQLLLIAIIVWFGRRWLAKRLAERRSRIESALAGADAADKDSVRIREELATMPAKSAESAAALLKSAREQAEKERATAAAAIEAEARQVVEQAHKSLELEKESVRRDAAERLVGLTTDAARRYLDEMLTENERRALTQKAILAFLDQVETSAGAGKGGAA